MPNGLPLFTPSSYPHLPRRADLHRMVRSEQIPNRLILHVISSVLAAESSQLCHLAQVCPGIAPLEIVNPLNHNPLVPSRRPDGIGLALAYLRRVINHQEYAIGVCAGA